MRTALTAQQMSVAAKSSTALNKQGPSMRNISTHGFNRVAERMAQDHTCNGNSRRRDAHAVVASRGLDECIALDGQGACGAFA